MVSKQRELAFARINVPVQQAHLVIDAWISENTYKNKDMKPETRSLAKLTHVKGSGKGNEEVQQLGHEQHARSGFPQARRSVWREDRGRQAQQPPCVVKDENGVVPARGTKVSKTESKVPEGQVTTWLGQLASFSFSLVSTELGRNTAMLTGCHGFHADSVDKSN
ncbi:Hypp9674 [Branchiostoma lanceolatum]|uniref:Hypp9674 protein n=1 Tax=Branchiostoma lanceolatum TaxID=7740 RepID=A0A8S4MNU0_BRALA|nr:Hypp9674 [Branchiostoma lanceolatum]